MLSNGMPVFLYSTVKTSASVWSRSDLNPVTLSYINPLLSFNFYYLYYTL